MDETQLRNFMMICRCASITEAAERLGIAQPSLSQQLLRLEDEFGTKLFHRTSRGVVATDGGRMLLEHASAILQAMNRAREEIHESDREPHGEVSIGLPATASIVLGVQLLIAPKAGCSGAIRYHLDDQDGGLNDMRRNIDAWWPIIADERAEAILINASGCGAMVKEYGQLLMHDHAYAEKARHISALAKDVSEILPAFSEQLQQLQRSRNSSPGPSRIAYHPPCTLQHAQKIRGKVEGILRDFGVDVHLCADSHLCCGSAGTYSVMQPALSRQLRDNKLAALQAGAPDIIVSGNIGCLTHLQSGTETPVRHWIELIDQALAGAGSASNV